MPANVANGSSVIGEKRQLVINALSEGYSPKAIGRNLRIGENTVRAVRDVEWSEIERRKPILAAQAERGALEAGDKIVEAVRNGEIKGSALIPAYGVFIDKATLLRGEPGFTMRVEHYHRVSDEDLYGFAIARSKAAKAHVVDSTPLLHDSNGHDITHDASNVERKRRPKGKRKA